jgi:hypothetical protein
MNYPFVLVVRRGETATKLMREVPGSLPGILRSVIINLVVIS